MTASTSDNTVLTTAHKALLNGTDRKDFTELKGMVNDRPKIAS